MTQFNWFVAAAIVAALCMTAVLAPFIIAGL